MREQEQNTKSFSMAALPATQNHNKNHDKAVKLLFYSNPPPTLNFHH
jgi:hypothetical protein